MATNSFANFTESMLMADGQVQIVDPADMKSVWAMQENIAATYPPNPGQTTSVASSLYERAYSPGANAPPSSFGFQCCGC